MKSKARFLPFVLALALLTSLFVLSPATAATGSVTLSKSHITTPGGVVDITVEDEGANTGEVLNREIMGRDGDGNPVAYIVHDRVYDIDSRSLQFNTSLAPLLSATKKELGLDDDETDRNIGRNSSDVVLELVNANSYSTSTIAAWEALTRPARDSDQNAVEGKRHPRSLENAEGGVFVLRTSDDDTTGKYTVMEEISFSATYKSHDIQTVDVHVVSTQDTKGKTLSLEETGASTGVFKGSFVTADSTGLSDNTIAAIAGSLITVTYEDPDEDESFDRVTVETTPPDVAIISPDHDYSTQIRGVRLTAQVTDTEAKVVEKTITFHVSATDAGSGAPEPVGQGEQTNIAIDNGFRSEVQLQGVPAGVTNIEWWVTVEDGAGNSGESDRDPTTDDKERWTIRIDTQAPELEGAVTGENLNDDGEEVTDAAKADPTSVRAVFDEPVDGDSLQTTDFRVNDIIPADVSWSDKHPESAFLTVASMASDATPTVKVVGAVTDTAGNVTSGGLAATATDGIAPALSVEVDPTYDKEEVEIRVRSDEALLTLPTITINGSNADTGLSRLRLIAADHYMATYEATTDDPAIYNVEVSGKDTSANEASIGEDAHDADGATTFEIDSSLPAPTSITLPGHPPVEVGKDLNDDGDIDGISDDPYAITTGNPFITIEWDSENEYDGDTHKTVDFTGLTIGNDDVSHEIDTPVGDESGARTESGNVVFNVTKPTVNRLLISARGLALGEYEMAFNGADELGSKLKDPVKIKIKVVEPDPFAISLTPGWNLVSLPAEPQVSAINDVMGDHPASIVLTYDPTQTGAWLSASRGDDGMFAGSLENISARTAYWIFTDAFDALKVPVTRATGGGVSLLPTVNLVAGWNLLPVLDVSGGAAFGDDARSVSDYVDNVVRTYGYDASNDTFSQHSGMLQVGQGYWAYLSTATVLVP